MWRIHWTIQADTQWLEAFMAAPPMVEYDPDRIRGRLSQDALRADRAAFQDRALSADPPGYIGEDRGDENVRIYYSDRLLCYRFTRRPESESIIVDDFFDPNQSR